MEIHNPYFSQMGFDLTQSALGTLTNINKLKKQRIMYYEAKSIGNYPIQSETQKQSALDRLHTKLSNAINPALESVAVIENKLHNILNLNYPKPSLDEYPANKPLDPREFTNGGAISELEETILKAHELTDRLQKIVSHLYEII